MDERSRANEFLGVLTRLDYLVKVSPFSGNVISSNSNSQYVGSSTNTLNTGNNTQSLTGSDAFEYIWGPRAFVEYSNEDMARFIADITEVEYDSELKSRLESASGVDIAEEITPTSSEIVLV
ncbi:hypothetical protein BB559_003946 [Furculomyces boomerangus]|uniref:MAGE domain-containing protein n=1 Tax=Furculomyces boomerangus TaxID=61424 RepID=A0A2T9YHT2_9FUNG|nr:hypothetical protein BB559_003946 [Furculomyces boomerangus]